MAIDWLKLRPWDGNVRQAFEELACQIARHDADVPAGSTYDKFGAPDGGRECRWVLPSGDIWVYQAKFFLTSPTDGQWRQMDGSVEAVLEGGERVTRMYFCLPIDPPSDPTEADHRMFEKWSRHVTKWQGWARKKRRNIDFRLNGGAWFLDALSTAEHHGRYDFWFNDQHFTDLWFKDKLEAALKVAHDRYTPDRHVDVRVAQAFDDFARTPKFLGEIREMVQDVFSQTSALIAAVLDTSEESAFRDWSAQCHQLCDDILKQVPIKSLRINTAPIPWDDFRQRIGQLLAKLKDLTVPFSKASEQRPESTPKDEAVLHAASGMHRFLGSLQHFVGSERAVLSNASMLRIKGDAGMGKTHLLCHLSNMRLDGKQPTVLLLGEWFSNADPLPQIPSLLGLKQTLEKFLQSLSAAGEARGAISLLIIDALNETEGRKIWLSHLPRLLALVEDLPFVRVVVSVRASYEELVFHPSLDTPDAPVILHRGFTENMYEAIRTYFLAAELELPSVPLLTGVFVNPLFLKLLTEGLKTLGQQRLPVGYQGLTTILNLYLRAANQKISGQLEEDPKDRLVHRATDLLAEAMSKGQRSHLLRDEAKQIVDSVHKGSNYQNSLFRYMLGQGLLVEVMVGRDHDGEPIDMVRFNFERLSDHLIATQLLHALPMGGESTAFRGGGALHQLVSNPWEYQGLLEALSIQVPERFGQELLDLVDEHTDALQRAFIQGLPLRVPSGVDVWRATHFAEVFDFWEGHLKHDWLEALITVAMQPDHPLNAQYFYDFLMPLDLAERDRLWSIVVSYDTEDGGGLERILDWVEHPGSKTHIMDESMLLGAKMLVWCFTSPNRFLRDRATKAVVQVLQARPHLTLPLVEAFLTVNDPYVLERVLAAAYGVLLRGAPEGVCLEMAARVHQHFFEQRHLPAHLLIRDYALGIVAVAVDRGLLQVDLQRIMPPYGSTWPQVFPSKTDIEKHNEGGNYYNDPHFSRGEIVRSITSSTYDFHQYVLSTRYFPWSGWPLFGPHGVPLKSKERWFFEHLTESQKAAFEAYETARKAIFVGLQVMFHEMAQQDAPDGQVIPGKRFEQCGPVLHEEEMASEELQRLEAVARQREDDFLNTLAEKQRSVFQEVFDFHGVRHHDETPPFPWSDALNWLVQRVFDLGWTSERFEVYDRRHIRMNGADRTARKAERVGKKYQWLALHELMARVADHFAFREEPDRFLSVYQGPWHVNRRDIDPSLLITGTPGGYGLTAEAWWSQLKDPHWMEGSPDDRWMEHQRNRPDVKSLLEVVDPQGKKWWCLDGTYRFQSPDVTSGRQMWISLQAFMLSARQANILVKHFKDTGDAWRWETPSLRHAFLGEYAWADAAKWELLFRDNVASDLEVLQQEVFSCAVQYHNAGGEYDCSVGSEEFSFRLPSPEVLEKLNLKWVGREGEHVGEAGTVVALDPSVRTPGPSVLLVDHAALMDGVLQSGHHVVWTVLIEKQFVGKAAHNPQSWRLVCVGNANGLRVVSAVSVYR